MKRFVYLSSCSLPLLFNALVAQAQTALYNFDPPKWVLNSSTPFLNKTPDGGSAPSGFTASFTSPTGAFSISAFVLNPAFSGNNLEDTAFPSGDVLTITLSQPITGVHLDFAQDAPGYFSLTSAAGGVNVPIAGQIGSLDFQPGASFTQFSLAAYDTSNGVIAMAIDNLVLTIPEPSVVTLIALGAAFLLPLRRKTNKSLRQ
jgi:hypothetical protein